MENYRRSVLSVLLKPIDEIKKEAEALRDLAQKEWAKIKGEWVKLEKERDRISVCDSELEEQQKKILKIAKEAEEMELKSIERERHTAIFMKQREQRVKEELEKARRILEESKNRKQS